MLTKKEEKLKSRIVRIQLSEDGRIMSIEEEDTEVQNFLGEKMDAMLWKERMVGMKGLG